MLAFAGRQNVVALDADEGAAVLNLDEYSRIRACNPRSETLFHYLRGEMLGRPVSMLFPDIEDGMLMDDGRPNADLLHLSHSALIDTGQRNPRVLFLFRIGQRFQALTRDGERFAAELFLNLRENQECRGLSLIVRPLDEPCCQRWAMPWLSERSVCSATRRRIP